MDLTDEQWLLIAPLLPPPSPARRGRPTLDTRRILNGIFWKLATHSPWYDMPPHYPSHQSCYRFYHQWRSSGLFKKILVSFYWIFVNVVVWIYPVFSAAVLLLWIIAR